MTADIGVIGAGSWGTALAMTIARTGRTARLWAHRSTMREQLRDTRTNNRYLPDIAFDERIVVVEDEEQLRDLSNILIVVPSHAMEETVSWLQVSCAKASVVAWATKGLDSGSGCLMSTAFAHWWPQHPTLAVVSGPSFAHEVARGVPTALTVASDNAQVAQEVGRWFQSDRMRIYPSDDMVGVQLGGAVKNVLAIATGIADAIGVGANTRAALITRGLAEAKRLSDRMGGRNETLMGLSGLGDLILTCTDDLSRNRRFGLLLGAGRTHQQALEEIGQEVEGVVTAAALKRLAADKGVEMPIVDQVYAVLFSDKPIADAISSLMQRPAAEREQI